LQNRKREEKAAKELLRRRKVLGDAPTIARSEWSTHPNYHSIASHFLGFHEHFRSDLRKLVRVSNVDEPYRGGGGRNRAQALQRRVRELSRAFSQLNSHLHTHHSIEDRHVFPQAIRANKGLTTAVGMLEKDHGTMNKLLKGAEGAISTAEKARSETDLEEGLARCHQALVALSTFMSQHLQDEEDLLIPLMLEGVLGV